MVDVFGVCVETIVAIVEYFVIATVGVFVVVFVVVKANDDFMREDVIRDFDVASAVVVAVVVVVVRIAEVLVGEMIFVVEDLADVVADRAPDVVGRGFAVVVRRPVIVVVGE